MIDAEVITGSGAWLEHTWKIQLHESIRLGCQDRHSDFLSQGQQSSVMEEDESSFGAFFEYLAIAGELNPFAILGISPVVGLTVEAVGDA